MQENKIPSRIVVYPKDVENITGLSPRSACRMLQIVKEALGKPKRAFITAKEFASYTCIEESEVMKFLR